MNNPLAPKKEEIAHGGQVAVVLGFIATFLLGVVFIYVMGNLLTQVSDGVRAVHVQLSGSKKLIVQTSAEACLNGIVRGENADILLATDKTAAVKIEEVLNRYDSASLAKLSTLTYDCTLDTIPAYIEYTTSQVTVVKNGSGMTVETALHNIVNQ
jgi:hypothetical protein